MTWGWVEFAVGAAVLGGVAYLTAEPPEPEPELVPVAQVTALKQALHNQQIQIKEITAVQEVQANKTRGLTLYVDEIAGEIAAVVDK